MPNAHLEKRPTGIDGLDAASEGGLPARGTVLVTGRPGSGKTVLAMQMAANAARRDERVVFVSFEESRDQLGANARSFSWGEALGSDRVTLVDGRPHVDSVSSGSFDLSGLLALLDDAVSKDAVAWVVLDGVDRLLRLLPEERRAIDEVRRVDDWCFERDVTLLMTAKRWETSQPGLEHLEAIEFLLSTVIDLTAEVRESRLHRALRIAKYRGSPHVPDKLAVILDDDGFHLPFGTAEVPMPVEASTERVGTGVRRLDEILGGGVFRGSTILLSGSPGTSKTTIASSFIHAVAKRGEVGLLVSFDEAAAHIVRNVASVGIDLQEFIDAGRVHVRSRAAWQAVTEEHFIEIRRWIDELEPAVLVIDPVSALLKSGALGTAYLAIERLLATTKARQITTVLTSLDTNDTPGSEATLSHASTLADTWITLDYRVLSGERNRALSIVKSRGTAHSNQVRELKLSEAGIDLADVYHLGTEVLMGTARMHAEEQDRQRRSEEREERERRVRQLEAELASVRAQADEAIREAQRVERFLERERTLVQEQVEEQRRRETDIAKRRGNVPGSAGSRQVPADQASTGEERDDA